MSILIEKTDYNSGTIIGSAEKVISTPLHKIKKMAAPIKKTIFSAKIG
jgi:hypothetical protein